MRIIGKALRRLAWLLAGSLLLAAAGVAGVIWLTLPGGSLEQRIPALAEPVEVTIDPDGIPRIVASNERDAAAALGFLHARERLFQMDLMRRAARGELSEVVGPATLRIDRLSRLLDLRDRAEADLAGLPADVRALLDSYAAGVNAWIERRGRFAALEFSLLGAPRRWTAADSLLWGKTMGLYLSGNWRTELARLALSGSLTRPQIEALWPDVAVPGPQAQGLPNAASTALALAPVLPRFPDPFTLPAAASNEWAVDGAHSATGAPLLAGDPHLAFGLPGIWYLARIDTPSTTLVGATAPGVPFLVIGHNGHIAWTFTTTGADTQDLFVETPAADGTLTEDGPRPLVRRTETIHVRGQPDDVLTVRETRHGPVVSDLIPGETSLLALSIASLAPGDTAAAGLLALNRAQNVAEAGRAAAGITAPVQNMLVADRDTIGLYTTGRVPVRRAGDGGFAAPGDDGSMDWIGWAQGDALPHVVAPASGRLVNANERVSDTGASAGGGAFLGRDWFAATRSDRIRAMLDAKPRPDVKDFAAMQVDDLDLVAVALLPALQPLAPELAGWDGRMRADLAQPLVFNVWMIDFSQRLLARLHVPPGAAPAALPWPELVQTAMTQPGQALCGGDCTALLRASHDSALAALRRRFGTDPGRWRWGDAHQARFAPLALRAVPVLGTMLTAAIAQAGSDSTVGRGGVRQDTLESVHGAAYRGIYDLANLERSRFMVAPGQSGDPFSALSRNFLRQWRNGDTISLPVRPSLVAVQIGLFP